MDTSILKKVDLPESSTDGRCWWLKPYISHQDKETNITQWSKEGPGVKMRIINLRHFFYLMCMAVCLRVCLCTTICLVPLIDRKGIRFLRTNWSSDGCELPCGSSGDSTLSCWAVSPAPPLGSLMSGTPAVLGLKRSRASVSETKGMCLHICRDLVPLILGYISRLTQLSTDISQLELEETFLSEESCRSFPPTCPQWNACLSLLVVWS